MYDKVKLWLYCTPIDVVSWNLEDKLDNVQHYEANNFKKTWGNIENIGVEIFPYGVSIRGSLPKFLIGNNIENINRKGVQYALEKIEDSLLISLDEAKVTELEYGDNFPMSHSIESYLQRLGEMPRRNRRVIDTTIYYNGKAKGGKSQKGFVFYDKIAEAKAKECAIPKGYETLNLLRYEMRLSHGYKKMFKLNEVGVKTLLDDGFLNQLKTLYIDSYKSIKKTSMETIITKPKDVVKAFFKEYTDKANLPTPKEYIEALKEQNVFENNTDYVRARKYLTSFLEDNEESKDDELITEMTEKIQSIDNG